MQFRNAFVAAIDPSDLAELFPYLKEITLVGGDSLYEPGDLIKTVYFPSNAAISVQALMVDGRHVETLSMGFEGAVGLLSALIDLPVESRMAVQMGGAAISLPAEALRTQALRSSCFLVLILRFVRLGWVQTGRSAACHVLHPLTARLARWLLVAQDRSENPLLTMTQDDLGVMAGALRTAISLAASELKDAGLIHYSRGHIEILDRPGLKLRACECYRADMALRSAQPATAEPDVADNRLLG
jgi:CRP-like cAMP-binding protein